jgi:hypothetical protein
MQPVDERGASEAVRATVNQSSAGARFMERSRFIKFLFNSAVWL